MKTLLSCLLFLAAITVRAATTITVTNIAGLPPANASLTRDDLFMFYDVDNTGDKTRKLSVGQLWDSYGAMNVLDQFLGIAAGTNVTIQTNRTGWTMVYTINASPSTNTGSSVAAGSNITVATNLVSGQLVYTVSSTATNAGSSVINANQITNHARIYYLGDSTSDDLNLTANWTAQVATQSYLTNSSRENHALSGTTLQAVLAAFDTVHGPLIARFSTNQATFVPILLGVNDLSTRTFAQMMADANALMVKVKAVGGIPVLMSFWAIAPAPNLDRMTNYAAYVLTNTGTPYIVNVFGLQPAMNTTDGTGKHYTAAGAYKIATNFNAVIGPSLPQVYTPAQTTAGTGVDIPLVAGGIARSVQGGLLAQSFLVTDDLRNDSVLAVSTTSINLGRSTFQYNTNSTFFRDANNNDIARFDFNGATLRLISTNGLDLFGEGGTSTPNLSLFGTGGLFPSGMAVGTNWTVTDLGMRADAIIYPGNGGGIIFRRNTTNDVGGMTWYDTNRTNIQVTFSTNDFQRYSATNSILPGSGVTFAYGTDRVTISASGSAFNTNQAGMIITNLSVPGNLDVGTITVNSFPNFLNNLGTTNTTHYQLWGGTNGLPTVSASGSLAITNQGGTNFDFYVSPATGSGTNEPLFTTFQQWQTNVFTSVIFLRNTIANGTIQNLTNSSVVTGTNWITTSNLFKAPIGGIYHAQVTIPLGDNQAPFIIWSAPVTNSASVFDMGIGGWDNYGTNFVGVGATSSGKTVGSGPIRLAAGDTISAGVYAVMGSGTRTNTPGGESSIKIFLISP